MPDRAAMHTLPPLKSLLAFDACMRLGSFTRAAAELNVGQPAISHQIQALESDLGITLFNRHGARAIPTEQAVAYHRSIALAFAEIGRASLSLRKSAQRRALSLATYPGIAMFWLMPRLARLKQRLPDLPMRVTTAESDRDIDLDKVDCAILFGEGNWPGMESHLLMQEEVIPVAAPSLAARLSARPIEDLLAHGPLIHLEDQDHRWFTWRDWRDAYAPATTQLDPGVQVTNHGIAIHQTLMGQGIALGWRGVIDDLVANGLLVVLDQHSLTSTRGYYLVASSGFLQSDLGLALREYLVNVMVALGKRNVAR